MQVALDQPSPTIDSWPLRVVSLVQRVRKLEKKVADRPQAGRLDDRVVYKPSAEELAEAVAILVECGAVRVEQY